VDCNKPHFVVVIIDADNSDWFAILVFGVERINPHHYGLLLHAGEGIGERRLR